MWYCAEERRPILSKKCKKLNKGKHVWMWKVGWRMWENSRKTSGCWSLFYQQRRRFKRLNEVRKTKRSRSGGWRRGTYRGRGWYRRRELTLSLWTKASRSGSGRGFERRRRTEGGWSSADAYLHPEGLLRRKRIYKEFRDIWRSESSRWNVRRYRYTRRSKRRRRGIYNGCKYTRRSRRRRRVNWPKDNASGLLLL